jgi:hypothetical protein
MRRTLIVLFALLSSLSLQAVAAPVVLTPGPPDLNVTFLLSSTFSVLAGTVSGTETITEPLTTDQALISDEGRPPVNDYLTVVDPTFTQRLYLNFGFSTFNGIQLLAFGTPATALTNAALQQLQGLQVVTVASTALDQQPNGTYLANYVVTGIQPYAAIPEPATSVLFLSAAGLFAVPLIKRRRS